MKKFVAYAIVTFLICAAVTLCLPADALAHGAHINYTFNTSIEITAEYDTGEPMSGAQVTVYAPSDPATPWLTGTCDDEGRFSFTPDPSDPGSWDVQVRQAGHGDIVHIVIGEGATVTSGGSGYGTLQIILMSLCVIWGLAGTALYFRRRKD